MYVYAKIFCFLVLSMFYMAIVYMNGVLLKGQQNLTDITKYSNNQADSL